MTTAVALSALALAACGSSSTHKSSTTSGSSPAAVASTPTTTTSASSTPTATTASSTPTATATTSGATSTSAAPIGGNTLAAFKAALAVEKKSSDAIGRALVQALNNAGHMTNATFASTFGALGQQFTAFAAGLAKVQAPARYRSLLAGVQKGYAKIAADVTLLSHSTTAAQSHARTLALAKDINAMVAVRTELGKAIGPLPKG
jgi:hypothetical protein